METGTIRVLLVHDDTRLTRELRDSLSDSASTPIAWESVNGLGPAIQRLETERFDAIVSDGFRVGSQGLSDFPRMQALAPKAPVIVLTSCADEARAFEAGCESVQVIAGKSPLDVIALIQTIREAVERRRKERRFVVEHGVSGALAGSGSVSEAVANVLETICKDLGWDIAAFWKVDAESERLRCIALWHAPTVCVPGFEAITRRVTFSPETGLPGRTWASAEPVWIENLVADTNFPRGLTAVREGLRAAVCFPVTAGGRVLGVVELFSRQIQPSDHDALRLLAAVGRQIGRFMVRRDAEEIFAEERNLLRRLRDILPEAIHFKDTLSHFVL